MRRVAAALDALLVFFVLGFACWTVAYLTCLLGFDLGVERLDRVSVVAMLASILLVSTLALWRRVLRALTVERSTVEASVTVSWVVAFVSLASIIRRPDADDIVYVGRSAWIAERGTVPRADTIFSPGEYPAMLGTDPPIPSWEALLGTIARVLTIDAGSVTYVIAPPILAALAIVALDHLVRGLGARLVSVALSGAATFLLLGGGAHGSFGNMHVARIWQGKVVFVAVVLPLLLAVSLGFLRSRERSTYVVAAACAIAVLGLTTSTMLLLPLVAGLLALTAAACLTESRVRIAGSMLLLATPAMLGIAWVALADPTIGLYSGLGSSTSQALDLVFGSRAMLAGSMVFALIGVWSLRSPAGRWYGALSIALGLMLLSPLGLRLLDDATGSGPVLWRIAWLVPLPALVGCGIAGSLSLLRDTRYRFAVALPACAIAIILTTPVWSEHNAEARLGAPGWKVDPVELRTARAIVDSVTLTDTVVLAPTEVSFVVSTLTSRVHPVSSRAAYMSILGAAANGFHPNERWQLERVANGEPLEGDDAASVATSLTALAVHRACVSASSRDILEALEWEVVTSTPKCVLFRPGPP